MDAAEAGSFARAWAQAWNDHDLEAILSHYADDVVFHSPRIRLVTGEDVDFVSGKDALRRYWSLALQVGRDLYFEVDQVFAGSDALTIVYTNHRQQTVAESFIFNTQGQVQVSVAAYS
jgi:hypothetical protein